LLGLVEKNGGRADRDQEQVKRRSINITRGMLLESRVAFLFCEEVDEAATGFLTILSPIMLELNFEPFPVLITNRLFLRQMLRQDAEDLFVLRSDPRVMKYIDRPWRVRLTIHWNWSKKMKMHWQK
jgi:hypothetical protein